MRFLATLMAALFAFACFAGDAARKVVIKNEQVELIVYGQWKNGGYSRQRTWSDVVGERVVAEGLAWGVGEKGLGQRVILDYGHVYVDGAELSQGKLVRIVGALERRHMSAAPPDAQGYGQAFDYFCIKAEKVEGLNAVKAPMLVEAAGWPPKATARSY